MSDAHELIRRLALLLDGCTELLEKEAAKEKRREEGKALRQITMQQRVKAVRDVLDEADEFLSQ